MDWADLAEEDMDPDVLASEQIMPEPAPVPIILAKSEPPSLGLDLDVAANCYFQLGPAYKEKRNWRRDSPLWARATRNTGEGPLMPITEDAEAEWIAELRCPLDVCKALRKRALKAAYAVDHTARQAVFEAKTSALRDHRHQFLRAAYAVDKTARQAVLNFSSPTTPLLPSAVTPEGTNILDNANDSGYCSEEESTVGHAVNTEGLCTVAREVSNDAFERTGSNAPAIQGPNFKAAFSGKIVGVLRSARATKPWMLSKQR